MNTNRDLSYQLYLHKVEGFERTSYSKEHERYADVREGRTEQIKKNMAEVRKDFLKGKGVLSKDPIRNIRYHIIVAVAMVSRNCIDGGMPHDAAYTLADIYIQRADVCNDTEKLIDLLEEMQLDYASRMRTIKKDMAISIHIRRAIDYIYDNLDKKLTVNELSELMGIPASKAVELLNMVQDPISLDMTIGDDEDNGIADHVADKFAIDPEKMVIETEMREQIDKLLDTLTPKEKKVIQLRFGFVGGRIHTLEEVGKEFKVTRERVRQVEAKALRKLRHPTRMAKLQAYI